MPFKLFEREQQKRNSAFEHAKIIAIVDRDGVVQGYDYTLTAEARDFFADPEDRKKYGAITVKPVACKSMVELQEKFRVAQEYLRWGAILTTPKAQKSMGSLYSGRGSVDWHSSINDNGMIGDVNMTPHDPKPHGCTPSPRARGVGVYPSDLRVVDETLRKAEYKVGDRVQLCFVNRTELKMDGGKLINRKLPHRTVWVTVVAKHTQMWVYDGDRTGNEKEESFFQDMFIGQMDDEQTLLEFNPKHVIHHRSGTTSLTNEHILKLRAWMKANPMTQDEHARLTSDQYDCWCDHSESESDHSESESESESDNDDPEPVLGEQLPYRPILYSKTKKTGIAHPMANCLIPELRRALGLMPEQQSDASPPESEPKPEQIGEVADAPEVATQAVEAEQIVPPPALMRRRRCDRPGWKPRQ